MPYNIKKKEVKAQKSYSPEGEEKDVLAFIETRIPILKESKKNILDGMDFEGIMKDADREYQPERLRKEKEQGGNKRYYLLQDEVRGIRGSRIVPISGQEGQEWRSDLSEPTLLVKIQSALAILIDQNPEAMFKAFTQRHKSTSTFMYELWKRNWETCKSKDQMKLFLFDLMKYGWAVGRTYPRIKKRKKSILIELDTENPEKNKYEEKEIIDFNDVYRERLDPYRTWIDDMTNLNDPDSMRDWYFEMDYSQDAFDSEFGDYENSELVQASQPYRDEQTNTENQENDEKKKRDDIITVGFYESKDKDLYGLYIPKQKMILYYSPLPNDDGKLSCWHAPWIMRNPATPYGVGLYEIIKNDKVMYDRLRNMSVDQLVMAIYPMLFYSSPTPGQGDITISPAIVKQKLPGTEIEQVRIQFDSRGFDGANLIKQSMDESTGITPTLIGEIVGKTLGETLHAKDSSLKRLNIPLDNFSAALEVEAYLTLSWMKQVYSIPEVKRFVNEDELIKYEKETGKKSATIVADPETGEVEADYYRQFEMGLDKDRENNLVESPESRFFTLGEDIELDVLNWEGIISIKAQSMISPSSELERQRKLELFNLIFPVVQQMTQMMQGGMNPETGQPTPPDYEAVLGMYKPLAQVLESQNEKPENWIPDAVLELVEDPEGYMQESEEAAAAEQPQMPEGAEAMMGGEEGAPQEAPPLFVDQPSAPADQGQTVVPPSQVSNPARGAVNRVMGQLK